jgi:hypothetical protein
MELALNAATNALDKTNIRAKTAGFLIFWDWIALLEYLSLLSARSAVSYAFGDC